MSPSAERIGGSVFKLKEAQIISLEMVRPTRSARVRLPGLRPLRNLLQKHHNLGTAILTVRLPLITCEHQLSTPSNQLTYLNLTPQVAQSLLLTVNWNIHNDNAPD